MPTPPAIALDTTLGGENTNSYCDVAFADDYFTNHISSSKSTLWLSFTPTQKAYLLVLAGRIIDSARFTQPTQIGFNPLGISPNYQLTQDPTSGKFHYTAVVTTEPVRYFYYQRMQFPRNLDIKTDGTVYIPDDLKYAQCEQAIYMANLDESALQAQRQGLVVDSVTLGSGGISIHRRYDGTGTAFAPMAVFYMNQFLLKFTTKMQRS